VLAIVLTYDPQLGLAELVHRKYADLWAAHPLTFRIPVNGSAQGTALQYLQRQSNCRLIPSPPAIEPTMRALLEGIPDAAWVFWCTDDRFPNWLDPAPLGEIVARLDGCREPAEEVKLLHWREGLTRKVVTLGPVDFRVQAPGSRQWGFWHHHFIRAGTLRRVFVRGLADGGAIEDVLAPLRQEHGRRSTLESEYFRGTALIPRVPLISLGEPLIQGCLTRNGLAELHRYGCEIPPYPTTEKDRIYNHLQL
jgi:hypothetical protein